MPVTNIAPAVKVTIFNDPGCPYGYSASPFLHLLDWRYGDGFDTRLHLIGLADDPSVYDAIGLTTRIVAVHQLSLRDQYGMPFRNQVKSRMWGTGRACRAVVAASLLFPGREWQVFRALQFMQFTTNALMDEDNSIRDAISRVSGVDANAIVAAIDRDDVREIYDRDRAAARQADGSPAERQQKTKADNGVVRYTAPTVIFEQDGVRLVAGGMQPFEVYDALVANLPAPPPRRDNPSSPLEALERFPEGLTTREVACLLNGGTVDDHGAAEKVLVGLLADGRVRTEPLGNDNLWLPA